MNGPKYTTEYDLAEEEYFRVRKEIGIDSSKGDVLKEF